MVTGGVARGLTVEAIERVGAETFIYGTREREVQGVAANPGELPPGEVIVRIPGAVGPGIDVYDFRAGRKVCRDDRPGIDREREGQN